MVTGPGITQGNVKEVTSWEQADQFAREFGLDPHFTIWQDDALAWCTDEWGSPTSGD
jgi:hypothetical protein